MEPKAYTIVKFSENTEYMQTEISYPVFNDDDLSGLNKKIKDNVFGKDGDYPTGYELFKQEAKDYYDEIISWIEAGLWNEKPRICELEVTVSEDDIYISDNLVSFYLLWWEYEGGAHGNYWPATYNFDRNLGRLVTATEISGLSQNEIRDICRKNLQDQLKDYLNGDDGEFYSKWIIDGTEPSKEFDPFTFFIYNERTLKIFFPPYTVAPYSAGLITVEISCG